MQDDVHIRPYITLQVSAEQAEQQAHHPLLELEDAQGETVLVHEQKVYLRDGMFNVIADHHLVLAQSTRALAHGNGDLRVYVDHKLIAVLGFTLTPSLKDRWGDVRSQQRLHDHPADSGAPPPSRSYCVERVIARWKRAAGFIIWWAGCCSMPPSPQSFAGLMCCPSY
ncbi:MAG UNVERIFIED_CONTAM: hypothetical protein LVT10_19140 [Anaerolineae bacterium]